MTNSNDNKEIPVIPRLRRVVDMSEINDQKSKSFSSKTSHHGGVRHPKPQNGSKTPRKQDGDTRKNQDNQAQTYKNQEQNASTPRKRIMVSTTKPVENVTQAQQPAPEAEAHPAERTISSILKPKAPKTEHASFYEAKTTRLTAPAVTAPKQAPAQDNDSQQVSENTADTPEKSETTKRKTTVKRSALTRSNTASHESIELKSKKIHSKETKLSQQKNEQEQQNTLLLERITDSLLLQTWRSKQWVASIAANVPFLSDLLPKCLPLVQARLVNNICIAPGRIEATVVDQVTSIEIRQFTPGQWRAVINALSDRAIFTTSILNGDLPEGIQDVFKQSSLSLYPSKVKDFQFTCDCEAESMPCEHICALLLAFTQLLEEDPFHVLTIRGMTRPDLLSQLRDARSDQVVNEKNRHHIEYELQAQSIDFSNYYAPHGNFSDLTFHIKYTENSLIKRLGKPAPWNAPIRFESTMKTIIDTVSHEAENLALSDRDIIETLSRAPRKSSKSPKFEMPDMSFITSALSPEILETVPDNPVTTAEDIIRWLKTKGAADIRLLARRTRLQKLTIEAFLNAFCEAGLTKAEGENDKMRFETTF